MTDIKEPCTKSFYKLKKQFIKRENGLYEKTFDLIKQKQCESCGFVGTGKEYGNHFMTNKHKMSRFKRYMF